MRLRQILARDIHVHYQVVEMRSLASPSSELSHGFIDSPSRDRRDAAGFLGQRDEDAGADGATHWMQPSRQGFEADKTLGFQVKQGLELQRKLSFGNCVPEVGLQLQLVT